VVPRSIPIVFAIVSNLLTVARTETSSRKMQAFKA
jgi:hypothetical protein